MKSHTVKSRVRGTDAQKTALAARRDRLVNTTLRSDSLTSWEGCGMYMDPMQPRTQA